MLHLASQSPRRRALLARLGLPFEVVDVVVPEQRAPGEAAADYVRRVAREKAGAGLRAVAAGTDAVVLALVSAGRDAEAMVVTEVTFDLLDAATIDAYVAGGEPHGKAGAYAIQGGAELFVSRMAGSHSGVVGLPLQQTAALLRGFGLDPRPFAAHDGS